MTLISFVCYLGMVYAYIFTHNGVSIISPIHLYAAFGDAIS